MPARSRAAKTAAALPVLQPDAAGINLGATEIFMAGPGERDPQPVRAFATLTEDLLVLAKWLKECGIHTVTMEATGVCHHRALTNPGDAWL